MSLSDKIKLYKFKKKWRKNNQNNFTVVVNVFPEGLVNVGNYTYGPIKFLSITGNKLIIGNYCSIASGVTFLAGLDHPTKFISTYPFISRFASGKDAVSKGDILIDDDVWIGYGATILSGVHIHQGAVIAAGAVVTKDVPPYAVVGGVPAEIIKYRFSPDIIKKLLKIEYSKLEPKDVIKNRNIFYKKINDEKELEEICKLLPMK